MTTCWPSSLSRWASLPTVVVLPLPLTPTTRITVGFAPIGILGASGVICRVTAIAEPGGDLAAIDDPALLGLLAQFIDQRE